MARRQPLQTAFTSGVLNPGLAARTDIQHYYQGMLRGINVVCPKEGGVRARWGRRHIDDVAGNGRLIEFSFNTEQNYALVITDSKIEFFREQTAGAKDYALITDINGGGNDYLAAPWTTAQALELNFTQSADTMIITHPDVEQRQLVRGTDHNLWTLSTLSTVNLPQYDFNDSDSPTPTNHIVTLVFNGFSDGDRYKLELNGFETPEIVFSNTDVDANERRIKEELLLLPPTGFADTSISVSEAASTYTITFSGDSADAYEDMTGRNTDNTGASITLTTTQTGSPRREDPISATRGWPIACTFYESRLLFAGLKSLPQTLLGTVIGGFNPYDFNEGTGLDDQGIFVTVNTDQVNAFRAIYAGRNLQLFTSGGEFYSPDRPLTPAPALPRQSRFGCASAIPPVEVDGATLFVTRDKKTVREYLFLWAEEAYNATSLSVLSSHLFSMISSMAALTSTSDDEDSYVLTINADGTGAILNTLRAQDIAAWTEDNTRSGDKLRQVATVGTDILYLVERERDGQTVYTLEVADYDTRLDAAKTVTSGLGTTTAGFDHLQSETVQVLVDGAPVDDVTVDSSGQITVETAPTTSLEAGYFVPPIVETMPLVVEFGGGPLLGARKRITDIRLRVLNSLGIVANGQLIPDSQPGVSQFATLDEPYTGLLTARELGYTDGDATITLTQEQPLPFHILALAGVLDVGKA